MIPEWAIRPLVYALLMAAIAGTGFYYGAAHVQHQWQEQLAAQAKAAVAVVVKQGAVTERVVTQYRDKIQEVKGATITLVQEIPVFIPVAADVRLPRGWRLLHDAGAVGAVPKTPEGVDVAAPDIEASAAVRGVVENYGTCRGTFEQLSALQGWVRGQFEATNGEKLGY